MTSSRIHDSIKKWIIVEPSVFIHTGIFIHAVLKHRSLSESYELTFVTHCESPSLREVEAELGKEFGDPFPFEYFRIPKCLDRSWFFRSLGQAWQSLRKVKKILKGATLDSLVTFFWIDRLVQLMGIPGVPFLFRSLNGRVNGIFFNARCLREEGKVAEIYRLFVIRGIKSGFFQRIFFLDHGACDIAKSMLPQEFRSVCAYGVDPWEGDIDLPKPPTNGQLNLLTFGAHNLRKGTLKVLKMLKDFPKETAGYQLAIVGQVRPDIAEELRKLLLEIPNAEERVTLVDRFVGDDEIKPFFDEADVVLCPYVDFHGSSNVVIRAAAHRLPVVVPPFSYLQEIVEQFHNGEIARKNSPEEILRAIQRIDCQLRENPDAFHRSCKEYADQHRAELFPAKLLNLSYAPL